MYLRSVERLPDLPQVKTFLKDLVNIQYMDPTSDLESWHCEKPFLASILATVLNRQLLDV